VTWDTYGWIQRGGIIVLVSSVHIYSWIMLPMQMSRHGISHNFITFQANLPNRSVQCWIFYTATVSGRPVLDFTYWEHLPLKKVTIPTTTTFNWLMEPGVYCNRVTYPVSGVWVDCLLFFTLRYSNDLKKW